LAKQSLLIADADPRSLRILEVALRKAGFSIGTATDGAEALRRIQRTPPDLVLSEVSLPNQDGLTLCRAVRNEPRIAGMPFLLMSAEKSSAVKTRAIEAGADDFLSKPLLIKELVQRVRMLLAKRDQAKFAQRESPAALTGAVGDLGLVDLFQSLDNWKKSALVSCESEGRTAQVWVREGQVVDAETAQLFGEAAFHRLLSWDTGSFRVEFGPVERDARIEGGTQGLLMEGMRRLDEIGRVLEVVPPTSVLQVDYAALAARLAELPDAINGVVKLADGRRTLREIIDESPIDELSTLGVVQRLLSESVLRHSKPEASTAQQKPSLQQWLSSGRVAEAPMAAAAVPREAQPPPAQKAPKKSAAPAAAQGPQAALEQQEAVFSGPLSEPLSEGEAQQALASAFREIGPAQASLFAGNDDSPRLVEPEAEQAAALIENVDRLQAEAREAEEWAEEARLARAAVTRTASFALPPAAEKALELVRFPPLRGVRRERLRREADEARASIAAGRAVRLHHVLELPSWAPDSADAPGEARKISAAVGEAARRFAPDVPMARLRRGSPVGQISTPAEPVAEPAEVPAETGAGLSQDSAAPPMAIEPAEATPSASAEPLFGQGGGPARVEPPAAAEPVAAEPVAAPAAESPVPAQLLDSPDLHSAPEEKVASELPASSAVAALALEPDPLLARPPELAQQAAGATALGPGPAPEPEEPRASLLERPRARDHRSRLPEPKVAPRSSADAEFEAELQAALGGRRKRWPVFAAAAAAAVAALGLFWVLRPQPPTDKEDSPWLKAQQAAASAPSTSPAEAPKAPIQPAPSTAPKPAELAAKIPSAPAAPAAPPAEPRPADAQPADSKPAVAALQAVNSTSVAPPGAAPADDDYARLLGSGEALLKRGKFKAAVAEFKRAVGSNPESVPALLALGDAFLEADAPKNAVKPLERAAKLDPRSARAQLLLGTAFQSLTRNAEAVKAYQRYLELEPSGEFARDVRSILSNLQR